MLCQCALKLKPTGLVSSSCFAVLAPEHGTVWLLSLPQETCVHYSLQWNSFTGVKEKVCVLGVCVCVGGGGGALSDFSAFEAWIPITLQ